MAEEAQLEPGGLATQEYKDDTQYMRLMPDPCCHRPPGKSSISTCQEGHTPHTVQLASAMDIS